MYCQRCGSVNNDNNSFCVNCGSALNSAGAADELRVAYSGFWMRFGAQVIDTLVMWAVAFVMFLLAGLTMGGMFQSGASSAVPRVAALSGLISIAFWILVPWFYFAIMESSNQQGTLGKMAVGIKVTDLDGGRIDFGRATGRYWGKWISNLTLYVGYIMVAFTARKQSLHDMMAGTLVVDRNPSRAALASGASARTMPGWVIALIILGAIVPVLGILAAIAIPAYQTYTLRAQVAQGLNLAENLKSEVAERLARNDGPLPETLATLRIDPVSGSYVSGVAINSGAMVITYGNEANTLLVGQTLALVPTRDSQGRIGWVCGLQEPQEGLELGNSDPGKLTTLQRKFLPVSCRP